MRSPKAKFSTAIYFEKSIKGIGQQVTFTADTVKQLKADALRQAGEPRADVIIRENKKVYPLFEWVEIERYTLNK